MCTRRSGSRGRWRPCCAAASAAAGPGSTTAPGCARSNAKAAGSSVQRILPRGEIESLDHTRIPRLRMPGRAGVFSDRAARLRALAADSPVGAYLALMATLADAQQRALKAFVPTLPDADAIARARQHDMPLLPAAHARDPAWRSLLAGLVDAVADAEGTPPAAVEA